MSPRYATRQSSFTCSVSNPGKAAYPVFPFTVFLFIASNIAQQNALIWHLMSLWIFPAWIFSNRHTPSHRRNWPFCPEFRLVREAWQPYPTSCTFPDLSYDNHLRKCCWFGWPPPLRLRFACQDDCPDSQCLPLFQTAIWHIVRILNNIDRLSCLSRLSSCLKSETLLRQDHSAATVKYKT